MLNTCACRVRYAEPVGNANIGYRKIRAEILNMYPFDPRFAYF